MAPLVSLLGSQSEVVQAAAVGAFAQLMMHGNRVLIMASGDT